MALYRATRSFEDPENTKYLKGMVYDVSLSQGQGDLLGAIRVGWLEPVPAEPAPSTKILGRFERLLTLDLI